MQGIHHGHLITVTLTAFDFGSQHSCHARKVYGEHATMITTRCWLSSQHGGCTNHLPLRLNQGVLYKRKGFQFYIVPLASTWSQHWNTLRPVSASLAEVHQSSLLNVSECPGTRPAASLPCCTALHTCCAGCNQLQLQLQHDLPLMQRYKESDSNRARNTHVATPETAVPISVCARHLAVSSHAANLQVSN